MGKRIRELNEIKQASPSDYLAVDNNNVEASKITLMNLLSSVVVGVGSFNGRVGNVMPEFGDYTPELIGIVGAISNICTENLPSNKVVVTNERGKVITSEVGDNEISCLQGVTSNIQGQINNIVQYTFKDSLTSINAQIEDTLTQDAIDIIANVAIGEVITNPVKWEITRVKFEVITTGEYREALYFYVNDKWNFLIYTTTGAPIANADKAGLVKSSNDVDISNGQMTVKHSVNADIAQESVHSENADSATNAEHAVIADTTVTAETAQKITGIDEAGQMLCYGTDEEGRPGFYPRTEGSGESSINVVQETGESTVDVMSQNAVTVALSDVSAQVTTAQNTANQALKRTSAQGKGTKDANNLPEDGWYLCSTNLPLELDGYAYVQQVTIYDGYKMQLAFPYSPGGGANMGAVSSSPIFFRYMSGNYADKGWQRWQPITTGNPGTRGSNNDANDLQYDGWWLCATNSPIANTYFYIQQTSYIPMSAKGQIAIPYNTAISTAMYYRYKSTSGWTKWQKVINEDTTVERAKMAQGIASNGYDNNNLMFNTFVNYDKVAHFRSPQLISELSFDRMVGDSWARIELVAGAFKQSSSIDGKENITEYSGALGKIENLNIYEYDRKNFNTHQIGLIIEDESTPSELIHNTPTTDNPTVIPLNETDTSNTESNTEEPIIPPTAEASVDLYSFTAMTAQGVKELKVYVDTEISALRDIIAKQDKRIKALEQKINSLTSESK